ncbi:MAG: indolepyruvate oxidoreductase subunit beta [archaeon]
MSQCNIMITGVGGQGVLFVSEVLGETALREGLDVRVAEIHGMAQRGGSVVSSVRIGQYIHSPTIIEGGADLIVGLEPLEVLRLLKYAHSQTLTVLNKVAIVPSSAHLQGIRYPSIDEILGELSRVSKRTLTVDAAAIATRTGSQGTQNSVMLGFISATDMLPLSSGALKDNIARASPRYATANLEGFDLGRKEYQNNRNQFPPGL